MRAQLKLIVLKLLSENQRTGYDLMKTIKEKSQWKPSSGSMYPLLHNLNSQKMIKAKTIANKKIYSLTKKGKEFLKKLYLKKDTLSETLKSKIALYLDIADDKELKESYYILSQFEKGHLSWIHKDLESLRNKIITLLLKIKDQKDKERFRKLILKFQKDLDKFKK